MGIAVGRMYVEQYFSKDARENVSIEYTVFQATICAMLHLMKTVVCISYFLHPVRMLLIQCGISQNLHG